MLSKDGKSEVSSLKSSSLPFQRTIWQCPIMSFLKGVIVFLHSRFADQENADYRLLLCVKVFENQDSEIVKPTIIEEENTVIMHAIYVE